MKNFFFSIFSKMFKKQIEVLKNETKNLAYWEYSDARSQDYEKSRMFECEMLVGKPVISISNEWDDPVIGFVTGIELITKAKNPILVVKNYLTNEEFGVLGKTFSFTPQRLNAILKLDPFELCSLIYDGISYDVEFTKEKSGVRSSNEELIKKLTESGFFIDVENKRLSEQGKEEA